MPRRILKILAVAAVALVAALPGFAAEVTNAYTDDVSGAPLPITDGSGIFRTLTVPGAPPDAGTIADVDVSILVKSPANGTLSDIRAVLRAPDDTAVELTSGNGGIDTDYGSGTDCTGPLTTFDDQATDPITGSPPYDGPFQPENPLSAFDGKPASGDWRLELSDVLLGGGVSELYCWKLAITLAEADLSVTLSDSPDPVAPGGAVTYTATVTNGGPSPSFETTLDLDLPASATVQTKPAECTGTVDLTCDLGKLAKDASIPLTVVATLADVGTAQATATVEGTAADPVTANDSATVETTVEEGAVGGSETISVTKEGGGSGTVTSDPAGIDCGTTCENGFAPDTDVTLTATPAAGSLFDSWGGACAGTPAEDDCVVTAGGDVVVTATFVKDPDATTEPPEQGGGKGKTYLICTITGTDRKDVLRGTAKRDIICGLGGNDKIYGRGGNDILIGGKGKDIMYGGKGRDLFYSKDKSGDVVKGGPGRDKVRGDFRDRLRSIEDIF